MYSTFRPARLHLIALLAALMQLWVAVAQGGMATGFEGGPFCGDGNSDRGATLRAQLPPELRIATDFAQLVPEDCELCCPLCSPVVPSTPETAYLPSASTPTTPTPIAIGAPVTRTALRPPVRGPPA